MSEPSEVVSKPVFCPGSFLMLTPGRLAADSETVHFLKKSPTRNGKNLLKNEATALFASFLSLALPRSRYTKGFFAEQKETWNGLEGVKEDYTPDFSTIGRLE